MKKLLFFLLSVGGAFAQTAVTFNNTPGATNGRMLQPTVFKISNLKSLVIETGGTLSAGSGAILDFRNSSIDFTGASITGLPGGGGSGTVTSVSSGNLAPLFTVSVATATSTPAFTFTLSNAAQNAVFAGPSSGGAGAPSYRALVEADIPTLSISKTSGLQAALDAKAALAALVAVNGSGPNAVNGLVHWTQLTGVPAGFADGSDDGSGGGSGTVTSVSSGNISSFATVGVTNPTTTPAFAFTLASTSQNFVWAGPTSGAGAGSYRLLVEADVPTLSISKTSGLQAALDAKVASSAIDSVSERTTLGIKSTTGGSPEEIIDHGPMGADEAFDLSAGNAHRGVLDANLTITAISNFTNGKYCSGEIAFVQDTTGARTVTWPAAVATAPTINPAASSITFVFFRSWDGGATIYAQSDYSTAGTGDFSSNTSTSADGELVLFSGTGGKTGKRGTGTGYVKVVSGVAQTPVSTVPIADLGTSTSVPIGVGSVEVGHASDSTITRPSAGDIAVEGNRLFRVGGSFVGLALHEIIAISDETTAITTGTAKVTWRAPYALTIVDVRASLTTASSSGTPTFDINEAGTTILSTKLTIDSGEKTSTTAATPAVISDSAIADDAEITIDVDTAGTGATGAKITIYYVRS